MIFYRIYQIVIMLPLMLVATAITAVIVIIGSMTGAGRWAGFYPPSVWSRIMCALTLVRVKVRG
ncbi:MAG: 1-acyl-sn-glycerol-3-phosphate acyltransferase, partial [Paramuribaculum sp.]|nr:1-acyl-sn-glycerol-3-phosphate acyltransferase [Paramuribaculum sp.]